MKMTEVDLFLGYIFHGKGFALILAKLAGPHFGRFVRQLIWSPWFRPGLPDGLFSNQKIPICVNFEGP
jgi:hypothetical protein